MSNNQPQSFIDYLDDSLQGKKSPEMEQLISDDPAAAEQWYYLREAVDAIQHTGLYEQVGFVRSEWLGHSAVGEESAGVAAKKPAGAVVRTLYRNVLRAAACIFILSGGAALYKYTTTSATSFYDKNYTSYRLNASRGAAAEDAQEQAYNNRNWADVLALFGAPKEKTNKTYFLAGMADLELKKYDDAIGKFQHIIATNALSGGNYYQDEAEFYLAMSWLGRGDANEALPLLDRIKGNKSHLYHDVVLKMSALDLDIIRYKSN